MLEELHPFGAHCCCEVGIASDVSARPRQAFHESCPHWIASCNHHDGNRRRRLLGRSSCGATAGDHDIYRKAGEIICYGREPVRLPFRRPIFKYDALAIDIAEVAQPSPEVVPDRRIVNDADAWSLFWPLLSLRYERPCHHTSETRDERAPLDALERHPTPPKGQPAPMRYPSMPTSKNEGASGGCDDRLGLSARECRGSPPACREQSRFRG